MENATQVTIEMTNPASQINITIQVLFVIGAIIGNLVIIASLFRIRHSWEESYSFILNVCVYDLLISFWIPVLRTTRNVVVKSTVIAKLCQFKGMMNIFMTNGEAFGILLLALDRFIFVIFPLRYHNVMTRQLCLCLTIGSAVVVLLYSAFLGYSIEMPLGVLCRPIVFSSAVHKIIGFSVIFIVAIITLIMQCVVSCTAYFQYRNSKMQKKAMKMPQRNRFFERTSAADQVVSTQPEYVSDVQSGGTSKPEIFLTGVEVIAELDISNDIPETSTPPHCTESVLASKHSGSDSHKCGSTPCKAKKTQSEQSVFSVEETNQCRSGRLVKQLTDFNSSCSDLGDEIRRIIENDEPDHATASTSLPQDPEYNAGNGDVGNHCALPNDVTSNDRTAPHNLHHQGTDYNDYNKAAQLRNTKLLLAAVGIFLITYFPYSVYTIVYTFIPSTYNDSTTTWLNIFFFMNCFINPFLYLWLFPAFRNAVARVHRIGFV